MKRFTVEFLIAMAVHTAIMAWYFRAPILHGQVDAVEMRDVKPPEALNGMSEMVYEVQAAISVQTREVKQGVFPAWDPYSQGGNPLIGKMQNAVFAPHHLLLYLLPMRWMPYLFTLIILLKSYLAFAFAYLFARSLRLNVWSGIFTGAFFVFSIPMIQGSILSWFGTGMYLPLLLLLIECFFNGRQKFMMYLWPWAAALPFFSGHFEGAFRINAAAAAYFLLRLRGENAVSNKWIHFINFAGLSLIGAAIASIQIYPAYEYVELSYNKIWHTLDFFGWEYETIFKHLSPEDAPMVLLGLGSLGAFYYSLKKHLAQPDPGGSKAFLWPALSCAFGALAIATLAQTGLDDSLNRLNFTLDDANIVTWCMGVLLLILAFWGWRHHQSNRGLRALGQIMAGGMFVTFKTPVLANALLHLPVVQHFHNASYHRWEYNLGVAVLTASALEWLMQSAPNWDERFKSARRAAIVCAIFAAGYLFSQPLKGVVGKYVSTGTTPPMPGEPPAAGGTMGPEHVYTYRSNFDLAGWAPPFPPIAKIDITLFPGNQPSGVPIEAVPAQLDRAGERTYYYASIPINDAVRHQDNVRVAVQIKREDGSQQLQRGTLIQARSIGTKAWHPFALIAVFLAAPLILLCSPIAAKIVFIAMMGLCAMQYQSTPMPPDQIPYKLAGLDKIKDDPQPFRISSTQYTFMQADYASLYGLSDLRTGGDNLDVLKMIHFFHLSSSLMSNIKDAAAFGAGLRLWGLANTKYLIDLPDADLNHPALEAYYRGTDLSVWKNKFYRPRALFFDKYLYLPVKDWADWIGRGQFLGPVIQMVRQPGFDWDHTILLHDQPSAHVDLSPAPADIKESAVEIAEYRPDRVRLNVRAAKPGFVFLSDNDFPGWRASVNGHGARILQSWVAFRAVEVPAGKSIVEFVYRPYLLFLLMLIASVTAIAWVFLYFRYAALRPSLCTAELAAAPVKEKKKKHPPAAKEEDTAIIGDCAIFAERIFIPLVLLPIFFWSAWCGFIMQGGVVVRWIARIALAAMALFAGSSLWGQAPERT